MLRRRTQQIRTFAGLSIHDQVLLAQTFVLLGVSRALINTLTFARLERFLGKRFVESSDELSESDAARARRIKWAIRVVSARTPWESNCFPQATTAKVLLRRRQIDSTLYLGAAFNADSDALQAHAWLRTGTMYVTGGNGSEKFGAIIAFS